MNQLSSLRKPFSFSRLFRNILLFLAGSLLCIILALTVLTQTATGRKILLASLEKIASNPDFSIETGKLEGNLFSSASLSQLIIRDREGIWLDIRNISLDWKASDLFKRSLTIHSLTADTIHVLRYPHYDEKVAEKPTNLKETLLSFDNYLSSSLSVDITKAEIRTVFLEKEVSGEPMRLSLLLNARKNPDGSHIQFSAERLDRDESFFRANIKLSSESDKKLDLDMTLSDAADGLIKGTGLFIPPSALTASLHGNGPLTDWKASLNVKSKSEDIIRSDFDISLTPQNILQMNSSVTAHLSAIVPTENAPNWQHPVLISLNALYNLDDEAFSAEGTISSEQISSQGSLEMDIGAESYKANLVTKINASDTFAPFLPDMFRWEKADIYADIALSGEVPKADITGTVFKPSYQTLKAEKTDIKAEISGKGALGSPQSELNFFSDIQINRIENQSFQNTSPETDAFLHVSGSWSDKERLKIPQIKLSLSGFEVSGSLIGNDKNFAGKLSIDKGDLSAFSQIANQIIEGQMAGNLDFSYDTADNSSSASFRIQAEKIKTAIRLINGLADKEISLSGKITGTDNQIFQIQDFSLQSPQLQVKAAGIYEEKKSNLEASLNLSDLFLLDDMLAGPLSATFKLDPADGQKANVTISVPQGSIMERPVRNLLLNISAQDIFESPALTADLSGIMEQSPLKGSLLLNQQDNIYRYDLKNLSYRSLTARGTGTIENGERIDGSLYLTADNLDDASPFLLHKISGNLNLAAAFMHQNNNQIVDLSGYINNFKGFGISLTSAEIKMLISDLFNRMQMNGGISLDRLDNGNVLVREIRLKALPQDQGTRFTLDARIPDTALNLDALLLMEGTDRQSLSLNQLEISDAQQRIKLKNPVILQHDKSQFSFSPLNLDIGSGNLKFEGKINEQLDLHMNAEEIPLKIIQLFKPDIQMNGQLNAKASFSGSRSHPSGNYQVNVVSLTLPQDISTRQLAPVDISLNGQLENSDNKIRSTINWGNSQIIIAGQAPLSAASPVNLAITGSIPLNQMNNFLGDSQTLNGEARLNLNIAGTVQNPDAKGTVSVDNASFVDSINGLYINRINALLSGDENRLVLSRFSAQTRGNGSLTGTGHITLSAANGFPGSFHFDGNKARLVDNETIQAVMDLSLDAEGALMTSPSIKGTVTAQDIIITIPEQMPVSFSTLPVRHINAPGFVRDRIQAERAQQEKSSSLNASLDIAFNIANRILIRGRGINTELAGNLHIIGPATDPVLDGGFHLRRGTLLILGKRLTFKKGNIGFHKGLIPDLDFQADHKASDITILVTVSGQATNPVFSFSSQPELPQDEVISRLLFGKPAGSLTQGQAIQLAQAVSQLTGIGSLKMLDDLSRSLGLDSITLDSDDQGNIGIGIGKRINENVYLGFKQGSGETPNKVTLDVDLTEKLKAQGEVGDDGSAAIGLGMEWEY